jgi:hypothetical protein
MPAGRGRFCDPIQRWILLAKGSPGPRHSEMTRPRGALLGTRTFLLSIRDMPRWQLVEKTLLVAVLLDLALGGNGYLFHIFGLRLREIFFVPCLAWALLRLTYLHPIRLDRNIVMISAAFFAVTIFDTLLGYYNGHRVGAIIAEVKPLSYFPMLFFFLVAIRTRKDLTLVAGILVACGMLLALTYLLVLGLTGAGLIHRMRLAWFLQLSSDEFIFRRVPFVGFFYKGDFYICVAVIFLLFDPLKWTKALATIGVVAIAMTLTRGLALALVASILTGIAFNGNRKRAVLLVGQCVLLLAVLFIAERAEIAWQEPPSSEAVSPGKSAGTSPIFLAVNAVDLVSSARETAKPEKRDFAASERDVPVPRTMLRLGDYQRLGDVKFILERLDLSMVLFGRGLGAPIAGRDRIESTYPEMLYKQGLPGLLVWFLLAFYSFSLYRKVPRETRQFGVAFLLSSTFVYLVTATNTFLTGSIGMAVVFISLASLLVLSEEKRPAPMRREGWYGF